MKLKNSLLVFFWFLISVNAFPQIEEVRFGAKIGGNYQYDQELDGGRAFDGKILFHTGFTSEFIIGIKKKFSLQTELLYSAQGFSEIYYYNPVSQYHQFKDQVSINYLSLPFLAKYKFNDYFSVEMGPYLSYMLYNRINWELLKGSTAFHSDDKYYLWNKDFGLIVGVVYHLNKMINFGLRYNYGFLKIVEFTSYNTQMFQFYIGYNQKRIK